VKEHPWPLSAVQQSCEWRVPARVADAERVECTQTRVKYQLNEESEVVEADTVVEPRAVVVHAQDTCVACRAVVGTSWLKLVSTFFTDLTFLLVVSDVLFDSLIDRGQI